MCDNLQCMINKTACKEVCISMVDIVNSRCCVLPGKNYLKVIVNRPQWIFYQVRYYERNTSKKLSCQLNGTFGSK